MASFKQTVVEFFTTTGIKLLIGIVLLIAGWMLINFLLKKLRKGKLFSKMEGTARNFIFGAANVLLKVILVLTIASYLGIPMASVVAVLGSVGLAVGLALQGSLANFAGGVMLLLFHPFREGDYVEANGQAGTVQSISILYTKLLTLDNKAVLIPNGALSNNTIVNFSAEDLRRVDLEFSVACDTDIERVKTVLLVLAEQHEKVLKDPAPFARLLKRGDSSIDFVLRAWTKKEDYWDVYFDLTENVKIAFDKIGIEVPYPHVDVNVKNN